MWHPAILALGLTLSVFSAAPVIAQSTTNSTPPAAGLESWLDPAGSLWRLTPDAFIKTHARFGFNWMSADRTAARSVKPGLTFCRHPVVEAKAHFESDVLRQIVLSLYNRGDAGDMRDEDFQKFMQNVETDLTQWAGASGILLAPQERTHVAALRRKSWVREPHRIDLVWSFSEKSRQQGVVRPRPEFARLELTRLDPSQDPRKSVLVGAAGQPKPVTILDLRARVHRNAQGDTWIAPVPMVDQGKKGYCAAAVTERVLRYYGRNLDQHEIAQLANTTAAGGTSFEQMLTALRRLSQETKMELNVIQDIDIRDFERTVADYNRSAKRANQPEVDYKQQVGNTIYYQSPVAVYSRMDPAMLREARLKRDAKLQEFKTALQRHVNNGAPLVWGCIVGLVKETPQPQGLGGHMRLLIGFNDRTQEVLYTDTWGAGHELKRLPLADAWTITLGLYSFQPRDIRF